MRFISKRLLVMLVIVSTGMQTGSLVAAESVLTVKAPADFQQLIKKVLPRHPAYSAALAELKAAKAALRASSQAIYNPEIEFEVEETAIQTRTVGLSQTIDWGDQEGARQLIAEHELQASMAAFQQKKQTLIRKLLFALVDYRNKSRLLDLSAQRLKIMKDFYQLAKQKKQAGDISQVELDLAQLAYNESVFDNARVASEQVDAEQQYHAMYADLVSPDAAAKINLDIPFQEVGLAKELNRFAMQLPQMRKVRAMVEARKIEIELRKAESSADPTIAVRGGKEGTDNLIGLTLSMPLNIRNSYRAEVEMAQQNYLAAEQQAQQQWRNILRDLKAQTSHYQLTYSAWQQWRSAGQISLHRQLGLLERLWQSGDMSTIDYLVQIKQNLDTQSSGIELQTTLWSSWLNWLDKTAQLDRWLQLDMAGQ